ncbi:MAG: TRAP transporter small permease [Desulfobacterales bacterium]|nr:MAG: TRAP transporter small permease [Desulfobacterales bacterium]UCD91435.1 MAG: TRAP transporter small permease [Desulfobacterales bacterium]
MEQIRLVLHRIEDAILVGLLLLMMGMSVIQIFLRNLFESGISWSDVLVRILVLWVGLVGAMVASRQGNHITIDILNRYLPNHIKILASFVIELFTAGICSIAAYYSLLFAHMEFIDGSLVFAQVPTWLGVAIIPFSFAVIGLRYFLLAFVNFKKILGFPS